MSTTVLTQAEMMKEFAPALVYGGKRYAKKTVVRARLAVEGEVIVTITGDGKETQNTAKAGDYVVENQTVVKEQYIVIGTIFKKRYELIHSEKIASTAFFLPYKAVGKCVGIIYNGRVNTENLSTDPVEMKFMASWNEEMVLKPGDMLVAPLPATNEIYRIAAKEFEETYAKEV